MKIKIILITILSVLLVNCAFKENIKRQNVGGTKLVIYEATEVALFKDIKNLKPTCLNGIKKSGASRVLAVNEDYWAAQPKVFTSSSQESSQSTVDSTRSSSSSTAPTYSLRCSAIGVD